jgi:hypothetical protein
MEDVCNLPETYARVTPQITGEGHINKMATDYPHCDCGLAHTPSPIRARTNLTVKQKDKSLGDDAVKRQICRS